jgi:hypothetical protein
VLGWLWLKLAPGGQRFWNTLGTFQGPATRTASFKVEGIKTLFTVAALALVLALGAILGTMVSGPRANQFSPDQTTKLQGLADRLTLHASAECLDNPETSFRLCFEADGNLVIYDRSRPSHGTSNGTPVASVVHNP